MMSERTERRGEKERERIRKHRRDQERGVHTESSSQTLDAVPSEASLFFEANAHERDLHRICSAFSASSVSLPAIVLRKKSPKLYDPA